MSEAYLVREYMMSALTTITKDASLLDAAMTMRRSSIRHLPIVDGDHLVGIITERDVLRCSPSLLSEITQDEYNAIFENTPIARVMTRDPISVAPDSPIRDAVALMMDRKMGCLPVVENGRLVGILTRSDLLSVLMNLLPTPPANAA
jgi:CBS domain-containing protein